MAQSLGRSRPLSSIPLAGPSPTNRIRLYSRPVRSTYVRVSCSSNVNRTQHGYFTAECAVSALVQRCVRYVGVVADNVAEGRRQVRAQHTRYVADKVRYVAEGRRQVRAQQSKETTPATLRMGGAQSKLTWGEQRDDTGHPASGESPKLRLPQAPPGSPHIGHPASGGSLKQAILGSRKEKATYPAALQQGAWGFRL